MTKYCTGCKYNSSCGCMFYIRGKCTLDWSEDND